MAIGAKLKLLKSGDFDPAAEAIKAITSDATGKIDPLKKAWLEKIGTSSVSQMSYAKLLSIHEAQAAQYDDEIKEHLSTANEGFKGNSDKYKLGVDAFNKAFEKVGIKLDSKRGNITDELLSKVLHSVNTDPSSDLGTALDSINPDSDAFKKRSIEEQKSLLELRNKLTDTDKQLDPVRGAKAANDQTINDAVNKKASDDQLAVMIKELLNAFKTGFSDLNNTGKGIAKAITNQ